MPITLVPSSIAAATTAATNATAAALLWDGEIVKLSAALAELEVQYALAETYAGVGLSTVGGGGITAYAKAKADLSDRLALATATKLALEKIAAAHTEYAGHTHSYIDTQP